MPPAPPPALELHRAGSSGITIETDFNVEALQRVLAVLEVR